MGLDISLQQLVFSTKIGPININGHVYKIIKWGKMAFSMPLIVAYTKLGWFLPNNDQFSRKFSSALKLGLFLQNKVFEALKLLINMDSRICSSDPIFLKEIIFRKIKSIFEIVKLSWWSKFSHLCHLCIPPF